jgi:hypothetical protein
LFYREILQEIEMHERADQKMTWEKLITCEMHYV